MKAVFTSITMPKVLVATIAISGAVGFWVGSPKVSSPDRYAELPGAYPDHYSHTPIGMPEMATAPSVELSPDGGLKPLRVWKGKVPRNQTATGQVIASARVWRKIWNGLRGMEQLPSIDFRKEIVILATVRGSRLESLSLLRDRNGHMQLSVSADGTRRDGVSYVFAKFPKAEFDRLKNASNARG